MRFHKESGTQPPKKMSNRKWYKLLSEAKSICKGKSLIKRPVTEANVNGIGEAFLRNSRKSIRQAPGQLSMQSQSTM